MDYLYFIALMPDPEFRASVKSLKEALKEKYGAKHALKSPAHITLQMPFKRSSKEEGLIISSLRDFASNQKPFKIILDGFGCFKPRVIFINVANTDPITALHAQLQDHLALMNFKKNELQSKCNPHMTLATRDLSESSFYSAWEEYENKPFKHSFEVKSFFLLRHNGTSWDIFRKFDFEQ